MRTNISRSPIMSRRRSRRPDSLVYRQSRKFAGFTSRKRRSRILIALLLLGIVAVVFIAYHYWRRAHGSP